MSRYRRANVAGGCYFFTVVTRGRAPIFNCADRVALLRQAFRAERVRRPFEIDAIVVLPNHIHALWRLPQDDADFSSRWREIKKYVSRHVTLPENSNGTHSMWQKRFWEHLIRDDEDWRRHVDYIHYNPVKHGLAGRPIDWPFSSFRRAVRLGWYTPEWGACEPDSISGMGLE